MPATALDVNDTFQYNSGYKLLICRQCRYAIQKSALESHLLRHKIYRRDRQRLLSSFARLDLVDPQHVTIPTPGSPPVAVLPVFSGFCCTAPECQHLAVSSKRMKRHWVEIHGLDGSVPFSSTLARSVTLQTFFRGTKTRYFEVTSPSLLGASALDNDGNKHCSDEREDAEVGADSTDAVTATLSQHVSTAPDTASEPPPAKFDMNAIIYFHHFMTKTSLTLPGPVKSQSLRDYWQVSVVDRALQLPWLMCGLLAISAYHLSAVVNDQVLEKAHQERAVQFSSEFEDGLQQIAIRGFESANDESELELEGKGTVEQIACLLQLANSALTRSALDSEVAVRNRLKSFLSTVRGWAESEVSLRHSRLRPVESEQQMRSFTRGISQRESLNSVDSQTGSPRHNAPTEALDLLSTLPFCMAQRLGRPENVQDVLATISANDTMIECCDISFSEDEVSAVWQGVITWLIDVPPHFNQMISSNYPAALVLIAHWAAILVRRAEAHGCWFLKGSAKDTVLHVTRELSLHGHAVQDLVERLVGIVDESEL